jgi:glycosyltransferase involved in cell wall biosynthesis
MSRSRHRLESRLTDLSVSIVSVMGVHPNSSGWTRRITALATGLAQNKVNVRLFVPSSELGDETSEMIGLEIVGTDALNGISTKYPIGPSGIKSHLLAVSRIEREVKKFGPADLIQAEILKASLEGLVIAKSLNKPCVLDEHNVEALLWYRTGPNQRAWKRLAVFERFAVRNSSYVLTVSQLEKRLLSRTYGVKPENIIVIPNGVDVSKFEYSDSSSKEIRMRIGIGERPMIFFMGSDLSGQQNSDALSFLISDIFPKLKALQPQSSLVIVGRNAPLWLIKDRLPDIKLIGEVDDVVPYISASDVCVAPLRVAAGTRLRILEYLSCGKAVVSTSIGAEGLDLLNNKHLIIEDDPSAFARSIARLLTERDLASALGEEGRKLARLNYDWNSISKRLADFYKKSLST